MLIYISLIFGWIIQFGNYQSIENIIQIIRDHLPMQNGQQPPNRDFTHLTNLQKAKAELLKVVYDRRKQKIRQQQFRERLKSFGYFSSPQQTKFTQSQRVEEAEERIGQGGQSIRHLQVGESLVSPKYSSSFQQTKDSSNPLIHNQNEVIGEEFQCSTQNLSPYSTCQSDQNQINKFSKTNNWKSVVSQSQTFESLQLVENPQVLRRYRTQLQQIDSQIVHAQCLLQRSNLQERESNSHFYNSEISSSINIQTFIELQAEEAQIKFGSPSRLTNVLVKIYGKKSLQQNKTDSNILYCLSIRQMISFEKKCFQGQFLRTTAVELLRDNWCVGLTRIMQQHKNSAEQFPFSELKIKFKWLEDSKKFMKTSQRVLQKIISQSRNQEINIGICQPGTLIAGREKQIQERELERIRQRELREDYFKE